MSWLDNLPASERAELVEAGRIGNARFGPSLHECYQCGSLSEDVVPLERNDWLCRTCQRLNLERYERIAKEGAA